MTIKTEELQAQIEMELRYRLRTVAAYAKMRGKHGTAEGQKPLSEFIDDEVSLTLALIMRYIDQAS